MGLRIDGLRHLRLLDAGASGRASSSSGSSACTSAGSPPWATSHPWTDLSQGLWRLVLPAMTLGTFFSGLVARIIRSSLLEVLDQDYVKAARARGVRQAALVYRHALANALIPVVTVIGLQFGTLLGGAVLTETVFAIPGMGRLTVGAILNRDYPVVQGAILVGVLAVVVVNLAGRSPVRVPEPADPGGLVAQPLGAGDRPFDAESLGALLRRSRPPRAGRAGGRPPLVAAASRETPARCSGSRCSSRSSRWPLRPRRSRRTTRSPRAWARPLERPVRGPLGGHRQLRPRHPEPDHLRGARRARGRHRRGAARHGHRRRRLGLVAGYYGGMVDVVIMRVMDGALRLSRSSSWPSP